MAPRLSVSTFLGRGIGRPSPSYCQSLKPRLPPSMSVPIGGSCVHSRRPFVQARYPRMADFSDAAAFLGPPRYVPQRLSGALYLGVTGCQHSPYPMATLFLICGLPGAGKTTLARQLEQSQPALRLCPDEWIVGLLADLSTSAERDRLRAPVEALQWRARQTRACPPHGCGAGVGLLVARGAQLLSSGSRSNRCQSYVVLSGGEPGRAVGQIGETQRQYAARHSLPSARRSSTSGGTCLSRPYRTSLCWFRPHHCRQDQIVDDMG